MNKPHDIYIFPFNEQDGGGGYTQHTGMSLRDYFAGIALSITAEDLCLATYDEYANNAYAMANAMLKAREL